jgi:hypothetical protein
MAKWLTQEWLDARLALDQPERLGASARIQYVIAGGPEGDIAYYWIVADGRFIDNRLGTIQDADVTLYESYEDAMAMQKGELEANAAFMQGKIKVVSGDGEKLKALLPITTSPEYATFQKAVLEFTEF